MDDELNYAMEARMRVALSVRAAQATTQAASLVPTYGERGAMSGELAEAAGWLAQTAEEALTFALVCERQRGTSWERIAEVMGEPVATVRKYYERPVSRLRRTLLEAWLDPHRTVLLPYGAADPGRAATRLDAWLSDDPAPEAPFVDPPDPGAGARPVSGDLPVMSLTEHRELLVSAARLIAEGDQGADARENLRRRRIALLEWLLAEELNRPGVTGSLDQHTLRQVLDKETRALELTDQARGTPPSSAG